MAPSGKLLGKLFSTNPPVVPLNIMSNVNLVPSIATATKSVSLVYGDRITDTDRSSFGCTVHFEEQFK